MSPDPFDLQRFVDAQERVFVAAIGELRVGRKRGHWMWFVFPQLKGLGRSSTSQEYGIGSLEEARAYLAHPILGPRVLECFAAVNAVSGRSAKEIFGFPDDVKFRSCATLFHLADPAEPAFLQAIEKYYGGILDPVTVERLSAH